MLDSLKQQVYEANVTLKRSGLVLLTWGNASGRDPETGNVVIKPSGVAYGALTPQKMVVTDIDGNMVEGDMRPSSDTPAHLELYRNFDGIGGIAHTHSTFATAWAQVRRCLPCYGTTHADAFRGEVPVTDDMSEEAVAGDYELQTGRYIVEALSDSDPVQMPAVLVAGHGPFTWGPSAEIAVENSIVLEELARMATLTEAVGSAPEQISEYLLDKHFLRKHGDDAYYGQK